MQVWERVGGIWWTPWSLVLLFEMHLFDALMSLWKDHDNIRERDQMAEKHYLWEIFSRIFSLLFWIELIFSRKTL